MSFSIGEGSIQLRDRYAIDFKVLHDPLLIDYAPLLRGLTLHLRHNKGPSRHVQLWASCKILESSDLLIELGRYAIVPSSDFGETTIRIGRVSALHIMVQK